MSFYNIGWISLHSNDTFSSTLESSHSYQNCYPGVGDMTFHEDIMKEMRVCVESMRKEIQFKEMRFKWWKTLWKPQRFAYTWCNVVWWR